MAEGPHVALALQPLEALGADAEIPHGLSLVAADRRPGLPVPSEGEAEIVHG